MASALAFGYLDDISLGGPTSSVLTDLAYLEEKLADLGLSFNRSKCEVTAKDLRSINSSSFDQFLLINLDSITFLGAPLTCGPTLESMLEDRTAEL